jgi:hypothetical protein
MPHAAPDPTALPYSARAKAWTFASGTMVLFVALFVGYTEHRSVKALREQHAEALSEVSALVEDGQFTKAFTLARPLLLNEAVKGNAELTRVWKRIVLPMRPLVSEDGATVYFKTHEDVDGEWIKIGTTPISTLVDAPQGALQIKVEKPGFRTGYFSVTNPGPSLVTADPTQASKPQRVEVPLALVRDDVGKQPGAAR